MGDSKLGKFKAGTERLIGRTNERLKQKMGRSAESVITKDDKWQVITANFNRQQAAALKLHREVKGYIASLKTMESSTQTLLDAVREMHEYTWPGNMNLVKALQGLDKLNKELNEAMVDNLLVPVNNYVEVFGEQKGKMQRRERKLIDYTRAKRQLDNLKKGDKISPERLGLAQDNFTQNKLVYDEVNQELCEDLPEFWNSRKPYIMKFLDGFFKSSIDFHREFSQVFTECADSLEPLKEEVKGELPPARDIGSVDKYFVVSENARKFKRQSVRKSLRKSGGGSFSFKRSLSMGALRKSKKENGSQSVSNVSVDPYATPEASPVKKLSPVRPKPPRAEISLEVTGEPGDATPFSPSISVEPGTVIECIHEYKAVDDDELSFGVGDIITVVAWDSTDEQDAGWFMGVLQGTETKGAFPINYTRKFNANRRLKKDPDPLEDTFQSVDLSADDAWRTSSKKESQYINIPELPDEPVLTNGNVAHSPPVEYSSPSKVPPKRPAAPNVDICECGKVTVKAKPKIEANAEVEAPEVEVEAKIEAPDVEIGGGAGLGIGLGIGAAIGAGIGLAANVEEPSIEVEAHVDEVEVETPEVDVELKAEAPSLDVNVDADDDLEVEVPDVEVKVSTAAPDFEVDTSASFLDTSSSVACQTADVKFVFVDTPDVEADVNVDADADVAADVDAEGGIDLGLSSAVEAAADVKAVEAVEVSGSVEVPDCQIGGLGAAVAAGLELVGSAEASAEIEISAEAPQVEVSAAADESEGEVDFDKASTSSSSSSNSSSSSSSNDLTPEEVQQKLAALGEVEMAGSGSDSDEDPSSPSKVRFEGQVSVLESVPEDPSDNESHNSEHEDEEKKKESDDDVTAL